MKLLEDIINELADTSISIEQPFLKMKILASRLKNDELLRWVNNELEGYTNEKEVPTYRQTFNNLIGTYKIGSMLFTDVAIPVAGLSNDIIEELTIFSIWFGVKGIEESYNQNTTGSIEYTVTAEMMWIIEKNLRKANPYCRVIGIKRRVSVNFLSQVLASLRSKLLNFALELEETFGMETDIVQLSKQDGTVNQKIELMVDKMINITGNGNIMNTGDNNVINNNVAVNSNDFESLRQHLKDNGVEDEDIQELEGIINDDDQDNTTQEPGSKVKGWMKKMLGKAIDGSWKISAAIAAKLIAEGISKYYGWSA